MVVGCHRENPKSKKISRTLPDADDKGDWMEGDGPLWWPPVTTLPRNKETRKSSIEISKFKPKKVKSERLSLIDRERKPLGSTLLLNHRLVFYRFG